MQPITVSVADATTLTGLSPATIYRMLGRDEIESRKVNGRRLLILASLKKRIGAE
jgi:predicted DNA-binding transcriptional regulator AlpA